MWFPRDEILHFEEILRLVRIFVRLGLTRFRITGGEPLLRRDLPALIAMLAETPGVEELSLTTNGLRLADAAADLAAAGLERVNISLDTLDPGRFRRLTRRDGLDRVLEGMRVAHDVGLRPVKINTVLLKGVNDDEVIPLVTTARENGWDIRFIEFMPLENGGTWDLSRVVSGEEVRRNVENCWPLVPDPENRPGAPATTYRFADGGGVIGFINSVTAPFCAHCSRVRLTADGMFSTCLYARDEVDLKTPLRDGSDDAAIERLMSGAVARKGRGGALEILETRQALPLTRTMHQIGG